MNTYYPISPAFADETITEPTASFRKNVISVAVSIFVFFIFYLLLLALAVALLAGCIMAGSFVLTMGIGWFTIAVGAGLIVLGIMVFVFFFKFIFSVSKDVNNNRIEIKEADQPQLFAFIRQLSVDVKAPFPKKIFLSPDVNACVFYNSSFLSLFFPVRKNLEIGLGLVNSLTVSEFKAVLAHEFGHFSQKSMKLGSYVYTVNRVLYSMVYEYDGWDRLLLRWENLGGLFGIFASITGVIVKLLRSLLREAYKIITVRYMALSREMEYNADLVAASVAGEATMISALRKIDFSGSTFNVTVEKLRSLSDKKLKCDDIFSRHLFLNKYYAARLDIEVRDDMIVMNDHPQNISVQSRLKINNQWASHPEFEERKQNLQKCNIPLATIDESAWVLFSSPDKVKKEMTAHFYKQNLGEDATVLMNAEEFEMQVKEDDLESRISPAYNGFYSGRLLPDIKEDILKERVEASPTIAFDALYSRANKQRMDRYFQNKEDLETLIVIRDEAVNIKSFDFDGQKYRRIEIAGVISALEAEIGEQEKWFREINQEAFVHNYKKAASRNFEDQYLQHYKAVQQLQKLFEACSALYQSMQQLIQRIHSQVQFTSDDVSSYNTEIYTQQVKARQLIEVYSFDVKRYAINEEQLKSLNAVIMLTPEYEASNTSLKVEAINDTMLAVQIAFNAVYREWRLAIIEFTNFQFSLN